MCLLCPFLKVFQIEDISTQCAIFVGGGGEGGVTVEQSISIEYGITIEEIEQG